MREAIWCHVAGCTDDADCSIAFRLGDRVMLCERHAAYVRRILAELMVAP